MTPNMLWLTILTTIKGLYIPQRTGGRGVEREITYLGAGCGGLYPPIKWKNR